MGKGNEDMDEVRVGLDGVGIRQHLRLPLLLAGTRSRCRHPAIVFPLLTSLQTQPAASASIPPGEIINITAQAAIAFVFLASAMLLLIFLFFNQAFFYVMVCVCVGGGDAAGRQGGEHQWSMRGGEGGREQGGHQQV